MIPFSIVSRPHSLVLSLRRLAQRRQAHVPSQARDDDPSLVSLSLHEACRKTASFDVSLLLTETPTRVRGRGSSLTALASRVTPACNVPMRESPEQGH